MAPPSQRRTEEFAVGSYALVALVCGAVFAGVQLTSGPPIGGAFLVIGAFWLCIVVAVAAAVVVFLENADRRRRDVGADPWASGLAVLMLVSLLAALYFGFAANWPQMAMLAGAVGLVFAPLGLLATVFEYCLSNLGNRVKK